MKHLFPFLLGLLLMLTQFTTAQNANLLFEVKFENNTNSEQGGTASHEAGLSYTSGISGMAVVIDSNDVLEYPIQGNLDPTVGSVSMWVRPNWDPGELLYRIMVVGKDQRNFELHMDEGRNLAFSVNTFQFDGKPISVAFADGNNWQAGNWYFLTYTWDSDRITIYVNGQLMGEAEVGYDIPNIHDDKLLLGSFAGEETFNGAFDELKIYDAPLTAEQISTNYNNYLANLPPGNAFKVYDIFGQEVTNGIQLVDWEGPVRNPALKYYLKGDESLTYPLTLNLYSSEELLSFNLPSFISKTGPFKSMEISSAEALDSVLVSVYMDKDDIDANYEIVLAYLQNGIPSQQVLPVRVIDQDFNRPLSYPVTVDFSQASTPLMLNDTVQQVIRQAAEDWLYYIDGEGIDPISPNASFLDIGGQDHTFEEKRFTNSASYTGFYLLAYGNTNQRGPCICSTGFPNRDLLQSNNGEEVLIPRIGALHLNVFGQAFGSPPTGWEVLDPYDNWTLEGLIGTDIYTLAKHEIGHAMVFEEIPLFKAAQERLGFISPALTAYYPDTMVPLFEESLAHVIRVLDPASQVPPYGGGVEVEVMPNGREMLTKLDILIMESVGYPIRDNAVTRALSLTTDKALTGSLDTTFNVQLLASGGIPIYHYEISAGVLPVGIQFDPVSGALSGTPEETGTFPITFRVKDYDERSQGASLEGTIVITELVTNIDGLQAASSLQIFPNPTIGEFRVDMDNTYLGPLELTLYDPSGKEILNIQQEKRSENWQYNLDLSRFQSGIYLLGLRFQQNYETYKIIKTK